MSDIKSLIRTPSPPEDEVWQGIELLFFAYRDFTAEPDAILAQYAFGRAQFAHFMRMPLARASGEKYAGHSQAARAR